MADEVLKRDQNSVPVSGGVTDDANQEIRMFRVDPVSKRLLVKASIDLKQSVVDKTDNYNVVVGDTGKVLTMSNVGTKTFNLPTIASGDIGTIITFVKEESGKVVIQANTGQYIDDSSSAGTIYNDQATELTSTITLLAISTTQWVIVGANGIWVTT